MMKYQTLVIEMAQRNMRQTVEPLVKLFNHSIGKVGGTITHFSTQEAVAALTFDDGPHPEYTPRLLDILAQHQARATFFVLGNAAQKNSDIVRRAAQAGHAIGNHSWDHPSFRLISGRERQAQIQACAEAIAPYGQRLLRPPYGHQSIASRLQAFRLGYEVIGWNLAIDDWRTRDVRWMAHQLASQIRPGSIVLLHDALNTAPERQYIDRGPLFEAVQLLLEQAGQQYRFVTVPELFQYGQPQRRLWFRKANIETLSRLIKTEQKSNR